MPKDRQGDKESPSGGLRIIGQCLQNTKPLWKYFSLKIFNTKASNGHKCQWKVSMVANKMDATYLPFAHWLMVLVCKIKPYPRTYLTYLKKCFIVYFWEVMTLEVGSSHYRAFPTPLRQLPSGESHSPPPWLPPWFLVIKSQLLIGLLCQLLFQLGGLDFEFLINIIINLKI